MKKILFFVSFSLFFSSHLNAAGVVLYDTTTANCLQYESTADELKYVDDKGNPLPGFLIFTDKTKQTVEEVNKLTSVTDIRYFKKTGDPQITEMTQAEKDALDAQKDQENLIAIGKGYKSRSDSDLLLQAIYEEIANQTGIDPVKLKTDIEQNIANKLGLPNL